MADKKELLSQTIEHVDIKKHSPVPLVEAMQHMAYSARDLARAADIYDRMLRDNECGVILCLAGSLISAGLKQIFVDMVRNRMVDAESQSARARTGRPRAHDEDRAPHARSVLQSVSCICRDASSGP